VGTDWPSSGEIEASNNSRFLMNCAAYLADMARQARSEALLFLWQP